MVEANPLTLSKLLAAKAAAERAVFGSEPTVMYCSRAAWLSLGGSPDAFDDLPTVDFGDDHA